MDSISVDVGARAELTRVVGDADTAVAVGSGAVGVLGTPVLLAWMERATCDAVEAALPSSDTTVGSTVQLTHRRPSTIGTAVTVAAVVQSVDGARIVFEVLATNADGRECGRAEITRVVVDRQAFPG